jgi:predicted short-subunit dehydrogenase-like oxidoreductase (DUF2520 family)
MTKKVTIIGGGKVGCVLGKRLKDKGYKIVSIISRTFASAAMCGTFLECENYSISIEDISAETDLILISVPDTELEKVARDLSKSKKINFKKLIVFHTSGALSSKKLASLSLLGAKTFSIHPFQTFISVSSVLNNMDGIYYGIEGRKTDLKIARQIVKDLGGHFLIIPEELKPLYHAAGVLASNYLLILMRSPTLIFEHLNIKTKEFEKILKPIMTQTMNNAEKLSVMDALTGPIIRGDTEVIKMHLKSISENIPILMTMYVAMGIETLHACYTEQKISESHYHDLLDLFKDYLGIKRKKGKKL